MLRLLKGLFKLSAFLLLVLLIAPALCGVWLQQQIQLENQSVQRWLAEQNLQQISTEILDYQRGWFSSDIRMRIGWKGRSQHFELRHRLSHGPLPWTRVEKKQFKPQLFSGRSILDFSQADWPLVMPELVFASAADFAGNINLNWRFLGYRNEHGEGYLDAANSYGNMQYTRSAKRWMGELSVPDLRWGVGEKKWQLSGVNLSFDVNRGDSVLPLGYVNMTAEAARWQQDKARYRVERLQQKWQLSEFDRLSNVQWVLEANNFESPNMMLESVSWDSILRGISEESLTALKLERSPNSLADYWELAQAHLHQRAPAILSGTEFEIAHLAAQTHQGYIQGFLRTKVPALEDVSTMATKDLLKTVNLIAEMSIPEPVLQSILSDSGLQAQLKTSQKYRYLKRKLPESEWQELTQGAAEQQFRVVVAQGLFQHNQGQYWSSIELKEGQLSFNGHNVHGF